MKNSTKILSWFLLGLYSLILFHNFTSHTHAGDITGEVEISNTTHTHQHDHTHLGVVANLFHVFADMYNSLHHIDICTEHFENFVLSTTPQISTVNSFVLYACLYSCFNAVVNEDAQQTTVFKPDVVLVGQYNLVSDPLRGPPSLA